MSTHPRLTSPPTVRHPCGVVLDPSAATGAFGRFHGQPLVISALPPDAQPDLTAVTKKRGDGYRSLAQLTDPLPLVPTRGVMRSGETRLVAAVLEDCHDRCVRLAGATGVKARAAIAAERDWLMADSCEPWSLAWCCEVLTATSGVAWDASAVRDRMLAFLDGEVPAPVFTDRAGKQRIRHRKRGDAGGTMHRNRKRPTPYLANEARG